MGEPDQRVCICCHESIPGGFHVCKTCKADLHSAVMCDQQWMPKAKDDYYFCSKACVLKHNGSDEVAEDDKMPLRRRPDAEEVETDAATQADHAQQPAATKRKGVELMAAATRPRRGKTGPAATGVLVLNWLSSPRRSLWTRQRQSASSPS